MSLLILITSDEKLNKFLEEIKYDYTLYRDSFREAKSKILANPHGNHIVTDAYLLSQRYEYFCIARRFQLKFGVILDSEKAEPLGKYDIPIKNVADFVPKKSIANKKRVLSANFQVELKKKIMNLNEKYGVKDELEDTFMKIVNMAEDLENIEKVYEKMILNNKK